MTHRRYIPSSTKNINFNFHLNMTTPNMNGKPHSIVIGRYSWINQRLILGYSTILLYVLHKCMIRSPIPWIYVGFYIMYYWMILTVIL
jgi:hypothetical protein